MFVARTLASGAKRCTERREKGATLHARPSQTGMAASRGKQIYVFLTAHQFLIDLQRTCKKPAYVSRA